MFASSVTLKVVEFVIFFDLLSYLSLLSLSLSLHPHRYSEGSARTH